MEEILYEDYKTDYGNGEFYTIEEALKIYENIMEYDDVSDTFYEMLERMLGFDPETNWIELDLDAEGIYELYFKAADIQGIPHHGNTSYWVPAETSHFSELYAMNMKRMDLDICEYSLLDHEDFNSEELRSWYLNYKPVSFKEAAWLVHEGEDIPERMEAELMDEIGLDGKAEEKLSLVFTKVGLSVHNMRDMYSLYNRKEVLDGVIENGKKEIVWQMEYYGFIDNSDCVESALTYYSKKVPEEYTDIVLNKLEEFLDEKYKNISLIEPSGSYIGFYYPKDEHYESLEDFKKEKGVILAKEDDLKFISALDNDTPGRIVLTIKDEIEPQL